jgi:hypothetical protein
MPGMFFLSIGRDFIARNDSSWDSSYSFPAEKSSAMGLLIKQ